MHDEGTTGAVVIPLRRDRAEQQPTEAERRRREGEEAYAAACALRSAAERLGEGSELGASMAESAARMEMVAQLNAPSLFSPRRYDRDAIEWDARFMLRVAVAIRRELAIEPAPEGTRYAADAQEWAQDLEAAGREDLDRLGCPVVRAIPQRRRVAHAGPAGTPNDENTEVD